jgi:menaquinone-dependent protoporphyrinogen oxidase
MPTRVLVAYATKHGSTREIAETIGRILRTGGCEVEVIAARDVNDIRPFDAVVLGSALYAAHWQREANRFVARHLVALKALPVWLFSSGPLDHSADRENLPLTPHVAPQVEPIGARGHRTFGGRLLRGTPGIEERVFETHPVGDFRDFAAIEAWAEGIARELTREAAAG